MNQNNKSESKKQSSFRLDKTNIIILSVFVIFSIATGILVFFLAKNIISTWTMTNLEGLPVIGRGTNTASINNPEIDPLTDLASIPMNMDMPEPWDGVSRVTVLLMGLDYRDWEAGEIPRTDTMMVLTIDPITKEAAMLSIPRDMWVNIPGFEHSRINTAYYLGELWKLPGGGPGLAVETVEEFIGVPIDYYAKVDFAAFVRLIDEIKGVTVTPKMDVRLVPIGGGYKETLNAGETYTLDGTLALAYARARYTEGGDFDRAERQQEVVYAIRDRILKFSMWPTLIAKSPILYQEISSGINTNMRFEDALRLATLALEIDRTKINSFIIDASYVEFGMSPDSQEILKPIPDKIRILRDEVFSSGGPLGPIAIKSETGAADVDIYDLVKIENARVSIQNGSWYTGLAGETANYLRSKGFNIVEETNAQGTDVSIITLYNAKPYSIQALFKMYEEAGLGKPRLSNRFDPNATIDVVIVLGNDWANYVSNNPLPQQ
jgi:LCP family protein required for cell wall assembly